MQTRILIIGLVLLLTPAVLLAQQEVPDGRHIEHHPAIAQSDPATAAEPSDMDADAATTEEADTNEDSTDSMLTFMQQRMDEMLSHWDKMSQTDDPAERQQLMLEHRQKMMALNAMMGNMAQQQGRMGPGPGRGRMGMGGMMGQRGCPMMQGKGQGTMGQGGQGKGQGMMGGMMGRGMGPGMGGGMMRHGKHHGMMGYREQAGLQEAYRQLERRVDLLQQMVEYMMQD